MNYYPLTQQKNALYLRDFANLNHTYSFKIPYWKVLQSRKHPWAMLHILMKNYFQVAKCHNWMHV